MLTPQERFNATDEPVDTGRLAVVSLADVEPERVQWLWPGRIPLAKLSVIAGIQGLGKSFLTLDMASRISNGTPWPDSRDDYNEAGNVILLSAEDALADTVRPRLDSCKANLARIDAVEGTHNVDHDGQRSFNLQQDIYLLSELVEKTDGVRLIVFDPIDSYLGPNVNPNRGNDIRRVLGPLAELAKSSGAAVVAVAHLNKSPNTNALFRVCGSIAYTTVARAAWLVAEDPGEPDRRFFLKLKFNLAKAEPNLAFTINQGRVNWCDGYVDETADEVLGERGKGDDETQSKISEAGEFLQEVLSKGEQKVVDVQNQASELGIAKSTLKRARARIGVKYRTIWGGNCTIGYLSLDRVDHESLNDTYGPDGPHGPHDRVDHVDQLDHIKDIRGPMVQTPSLPEQPSSRRETTPNGCVDDATLARDRSEPGPR